MNLEKLLIEKTFYESFMEGRDGAHPAAVLAEAYLEARQKGEEGLPEIRFAQGEVYFALRDYDAAIHKWKNGSGSFKQWSVKNTADAYYELGELAIAEDFYKSVITENPSLKAEVALQLFSLFIERGKNNEASGTIKALIEENPGYPDAAGLARNFFESQGDWESATELAVNETIRTNSAEWADILVSYAEKGVTNHRPPSYFRNVLPLLYGIDEYRFGRLGEALWVSYAGHEEYLSWIGEFNSVLDGLDTLPSGIWPGLAELYKRAYVDFTTSGNYSIESLTVLMPSLLRNWLAISDSKTQALAASGLLAWSGKFPDGIPQDAIEAAEKILTHSKRTENDFTEGLALLSEISAWASGLGLQIGPRLEWLAGQLADFRTRHIVTVGMKGSGKAGVLRLILGDAYPEEAETAQAALAFRYRDQAAVSIVTDEGLVEGESLEEIAEAEEENGIYTFSLPVPFLKDSGLTIIDLPEFKDEVLAPEDFEYILLADTLLFAVEATEPLTTAEGVVLAQIRENMPGLPVHFLLSQQGMPDPHGLEQASMLVKAAFPDSEVIKAAPSHDRQRLFETILKTAVIGTPERSILGNRTDKLLLLIRRTLDHLLSQRIEQEKGIQTTIETQEQMAAKLTGAMNQLNDIESERVEKVQKSFRKIIDEAKGEMEAYIPEVIRGASDFINETSDFRTIHLSLNDEMNRRLNAYLNESALPKLRAALEGWIEETGGDLVRVQEFLDEMSESFNSLFGRDWIKLDCDFKVLEDWKRDTLRMTASYSLDKVNIMLRRTPSQILLKGAGKLLGSLPQNNAMLYNRYRTFIENEDYSDIAKLVNSRFFMQFDLFEKALGRDMAAFFQNPHQVLAGTLRETEARLEESREQAREMKRNPGKFHDPMSLFAVRLRQLEWLEITQ